jgi:NAD(P)-dependent dehydrogenase (short-subunit alcohol dehydrogenase family)
MGRLAGKHAIVTGAGAGIGLAIVTRFRQEGARVIAVDMVATPELTEAADGDVIVVLGDVSSEDTVATMISRAGDDWGRLDVLVNCAGIGRPNPLCDVPLEDFRAVLEVNLVAPFMAMKHAIPLMIAGGGGSIVNIGSVQSLVAQPHCAPYAASKGGLLMLSRAAAVDYGSQRIRSNTICPGTIDTPRLGKLSAEQIDRLRSLHPVGRLGQADEVASMAVFLASDESAFCTGGAYVVDGGRTAT